ncbi:thiamine phosphate synthase [Vitreimonas flagellata]|uniref:thiamine phosphate synthase n=1 Tax=Vitreimonas flagellata TaxID=2560861 RepID=UPI0014322F4D|nr:thiamine phosphate synthase [Vitreimonas flagellata]
MGSIHALAAQARRLNTEVGATGVPALYFFTDPLRTPDPIAITKRLPRGTAVVYRHFGVEEREEIARGLGTLCRSRGLILLVSGDAALARRVRAHGVHWPERLLPKHRDYALSLETASAHSAEALARAASFGASACVLAPVFETRSSSGNAPLGLFHASQMARAARLPVIALGGIDSKNARTLSGRGFAGLAAVDAFAA